TDAPVLISGETGVGKEWIAAILHRNSRRAGGPFEILRCAAAIDGVDGVDAIDGAATAPDRLRAAVSGARGGTLVLDDVDALPPAHQRALAAALDGERAREDGPRLLALSRRDHRAL